MTPLPTPPLPSPRARRYINKVALALMVALPGAAWSIVYASPDHVEADDQVAKQAAWMEMQRHQGGAHSHEHGHEHGPG